MLCVVECARKGVFKRPVLPPEEYGMVSINISVGGKKKKEKKKAGLRVSSSGGITDPDLATAKAESELRRS